MLEGWKALAAMMQVLFSLPKAILTKQLLKDVWQRIVDSFKNMARSRTGMVFSLIGDLDFYYGEFNWPRHNVPNPCPFCHANQRPSLQASSSVVLFLVDGWVGGCAGMCSFNWS